MRLTAVDPFNYEEAPNVVSEEGSKHLLAEGWQMDVVCLVAAEKRHASYYGQWGIRFSSPDERFERYLVTARKLMEMRTFKTINGLVSFVQDFGVNAPQIPLQKGMRCRQQIDPTQE